MANQLKYLCRYPVDLKECSRYNSLHGQGLATKGYIDEFRELGKTADNIEILGRYKNPRWGFLSLSRRNDNYLISFSSYRQSMHKKRSSKSMSERRKLFKIKVKNHDTI